MQNVFNSATLSHLRPETLIGLQDVQLSLRAMAMPGVLSVDFSISDVDSIHGEDADPIDVKDEMRLPVDQEELMVLTEHHIIVGGLAYDNDGSASDPTDGDGQGKIHFAGRRGSEDDRQAMFKALGLDSYGGKDLRSEAVEDAMLENALEVLRKDHYAMRALSNRCRARGFPYRWVDVIERVRAVISRAGWENAMDELANELFGERYWTRVPSKAADAGSNLDFALREDKAEQVWDTLREKGLVGNPLAVLLDVYEHGGTSYSVSGEGMQCRWDTSRGAGIWIPDECAVENITSGVLHKLGYGQIQWFGACGSTTDPLNAGYSLDGGATWVQGFSSWKSAMAEVRKSVPEAAREDFQAAMTAEARNYARSVVEEYSKWANGEVYGVLVYAIDRQTGQRLEQHDHEVWGHIGSDYAEETLHDEVMNMIDRLTKTLH